MWEYPSVYLPIFLIVLFLGVSWKLKSNLYSFHGVFHLTNENWGLQKLFKLLQGFIGLLVFDLKLFDV